MRRYWGNLNFMTPAWRADVGNAGDFVVDSYRHGPSDLRVAYELLVLAGHVELAERLDEVLEQAYKRETAVLDDAETNELIGILGKVEELVQGRLIDANSRVPPDKIDELKRRSTVLDFGDEGGHQPEDGVAEGLSRVYAVRDALVSARDRGLNTALN
jgi:hypothetical protein